MGDQAPPTPAQKRNITGVIVIPQGTTEETPTFVETQVRAVTELGENKPPLLVGEACSVITHPYSTLFA